MVFDSLILFFRFIFLTGVAFHRRAFRMNRDIIKVIILITTIALLSLITVQAYWVISAIGAEQRNFRNNVDEATNNVIDGIEKIVTAARLQQTLHQKKNVNQFISSIDSLDVMIAHYQSSQNENRNLGNILRTTLYAGEILKEMLLKTQPIDWKTLITPQILDSLLTSEFRKNGLDILFEFAIYNTSIKSFVLEKSGNYTRELLSTPYIYNLNFTGEQENNELLFLYFPDKNIFIYKKTAGMILISLILIILIMMLFIYVIKVIVWQNRLSEMKNDFINNMTHEIKTPIATISLACEALHDPDIKHNDVLASSYLRVIRDENQRLAAIVEKILQNALIEKEDFRLNREKLNIHDLIQHVINNMAIHVEVKDGKIITHFDATRPFIFADKGHLTNVIANLLDNATKYTPRKPIITITTGNYPEGVTVAVSDNGIGISKEDQKKIFDKLYRVPTGNVHDVKGFGLGLSYVKTIVEQHGGKVTVESEPGHGSTFTIYLPFSGKSRKDH